MTLAAFAAAAEAKPVTVAGKTRYIVTFDAKAKQGDRDSSLAALGLSASMHIATDGDSPDEVSMAVVDVPAGQAPPAVGGRIVSVEMDQNVRWIESAQPSFQSTPFTSRLMDSLKMPRASDIGRDMPSYLMFAQRPELTWGLKRVQAPAAWAVCARDKVKTCEGAFVKVAVLDTGIFAEHSDLLGQVDGGYSALTKSENPKDYSDDNDEPGHGTHVAGTIAAVKDGKGVVGVAPSARLYSVKVLDKNGSGNMSDIIDGLVWAVKNRMDVVNMSLGAPIDSDALKAAVRKASGSGGVIIVAAAGNSGAAVSYPGAYDDVITVGASDFEDKLAPFSSRGPAVDFIAPGVDILSTRVGGGWLSLRGTSMACPHVAGLAAIAIAQGYKGLNGPDGVMAQLKKAASPLRGEMTAEMQGAGMIDAGRLAR
jgi:subtilisin